MADEGLNIKIARANVQDQVVQREHAVATEKAQAMATENHVDADSINSYEDDIEEEAEEEDLTLIYFESLFRRDGNERATFLENFTKSVRKWVSRPDDVASQRLLQAHLPTALRLSINSPFEDIRVAMKNLLEELEVQRS